MKTFDVNAYGVHEMNAVEMQNVDAGCIILSTSAIVAIWAIQAGICVGLIGAYATLKTAD
jgi:hypothetical protein